MKCWSKIRSHDRHLWNASDDEIGHFLRLAAERILDLKRDPRIKYVSLFKDYGKNAGQEFSHPTSQITATMFVPRRVLYELRAGREYFSARSAASSATSSSRKNSRPARDRGSRRLCRSLSLRAARSLRNLDPAAQPRSVIRAHGLEQAGTARNLAALLRRTLQRIRTVTEDFHLVLHTSPSSLHPSKNLGYWKTIDEDYHWHIEILPVIASKAKSYTFKEVYYSPVSSETAVKQLREAKIDG